MESDTKPSRLMSQDPQEVNTPGNKPSESQPGASPHQNLVTGPGDAQQGTTGAPNVEGDNMIPDPVNPHETKPATTNYTTENDAYAQGMPSQEAMDAANETRSAPPPGRR